MNQAELNRQVARVTGETVSTIRRLGFLLAEPNEGLPPDSAEHGPYVIDWDALEAQRSVDNVRRPSNEPVAV